MSSSRNLGLNGAICGVCACLCGALFPGDFLAMETGTTITTAPAHHITRFSAAYPFFTELLSTGTAPSGCVRRVNVGVLNGAQIAALDERLRLIRDGWMMSVGKDCALQFRWHAVDLGRQREACYPCVHVLARSRRHVSSRIYFLRRSSRWIEYCPYQDLLIL